MSILDFLKGRRTETPFADDKAVRNFARVAEEMKLFPLEGLAISSDDMDANGFLKPAKLAELEQQATMRDRLAKALGKAAPEGDAIEGIAKLLGQIEDPGRS